MEEYKREYYQRNKENILRYQKKYNQENSEKIRQYQRKYQKEKIRKNQCPYCQKFFSMYYLDYHIFKSH